jgi:glycerate 2-kinase
VDARRVTAHALQSLDIRTDARPLRVVAAGKAAVGMATAVAAFLKSERPAGAMMTAEVAAGAHLEGWLAVAGTHPHPSAASEAAGRAALRLADETAEDDGCLLVCLSGGASAMMAVPAAGVTIEEKAQTTDVLLRAGLDIAEVNTIRRQLSAIKGGQLAGRARRTVTLAISDVCTPVEDDPLVIGSGPTVGDPSPAGRATRVVDMHHLRSRLPASVLRALDRQAEGGDGPLSPSDPRLARSVYAIIASRKDAMRTAAETARRLGYHVTVHEPAVVGEATRAAGPLVALASGMPRPACVIASGETIVHVRGNGQGGRNQEMAVSALEPLASIGMAAMACVGTDGRDGPTDAAGGFVDSTMWAELGSAEEARRTCADALARNDAYPLLARLEALVRTGPTGTNVGDLSIVLVP